jgi:hypothetical protein
LLHLLCEITLLFEKLFKTASISFFGGLRFECTFCILSPLLFLLKLPDLSIFLCKPLADLITDCLLLLFEKMNPFFFLESLVFNESLKIQEQSLLAGRINFGGNDGWDQ